MNQRKQILYIGGFILPDGNAAAHRVLANGEILADLGFEVIFLGVDPASVAGFEDVPEVGLAGRFRFFHQRYPRSIPDWITYLSSLLPFRSVVSRLGMKSIVGVIAYNCPAIVLYKMQRYCKRHRITLIADCTEWYQADRGSFVFRLLKNLDTMLRMKTIQPNLDGIICISSFLKDFYEKKKCSTVLIPPLVNKQNAKWKRPAMEERQNQNIRFVYAGSPGSTKDRLDKLISALSRLALCNYEFSLAVIGLSKEDYIDGDMLRKESLRVLENKISFTGRISHLDAIEIIKRSSFSVFFRDDTIVSRAGFPTKFVESIACGTPVITNISSDLEKFLIPGITGYFLDATSVDTIAAGMQSIFLLDEQSIAKMKDACFENEDFDFRNYIPVMSSFLSKCGISVHC